MAHVTGIIALIKTGSPPARGWRRISYHDSLCSLCALWWLVLSLRPSG